MLTRASIRSFATESLKVIHNVARQQFVVSLKSAEAVLSYEKGGDKITFVHTDVPQEFQGRGVGKLLAKHAFDYALSNKLDVTCKCHFLAKFYENNIDKYKDLQVKLQLD